MRVYTQSDARQESPQSSTNPSEKSLRLKRQSAEIAPTVSLESRFFHGPARLRVCPSWARNAVKDGPR
jgi:hypothetical protein